ncbi:MAG: DNA mismatch repair protein MutS [Waddliaceae bacterium]
MTISEEKTTTPMMAQWEECKQAVGNAVLFFRMGDFYEAFHEDAKILAQELSLTLTKRQGIPMSGVPHHSSRGYIDKLIEKGYRVAIAEQTEAPEPGKKLVNREVMRIVTPGTLIDSDLLTDKENNYFVSTIQVGAIYGIAALDLSTGEFRLLEVESKEDLLSQLQRYRPKEIFTSRPFFDKHVTVFKELKQSFNPLITQEEAWRFSHEVTYTFLLDHFSVKSLEGYGVHGMVAAINCAGGLLQYIQDSLSLPIDHIQGLSVESLSEFMVLDQTTRANLELVRSLNAGTRKNTLINILDETQTAMGARLLQHWVLQPLLSIERILDRQEVVQTFTQNRNSLDSVRSLLSHIRDLERLIMKVQTGSATPRDLVAIKLSCQQLPHLKAMVASISDRSPFLQKQLDHLPNLSALVALIEKSIVNEPPARVSDGGVIRGNFNKELDEYRLLAQNGKTWMAKYQEQLREKYGIKNLKLGYNKMFGYYIEISRGQLGQVPESFDRKQTLVNAERFITQELKEYEQKVLTAEEKMYQLESSLFSKVKEQVATFNEPVQKTARAIGVIDALQSLSYIAIRYRWNRPLVDDGDQLIIQDGRHPVIEIANRSEPFIPNDTELTEKERLFLITGPNMAGKSTYLRQVALITLLAQIGSFVPARAAHIGICDRIFTRIGASDDLTRGQSTFMVEMSEAANILNNVSPRSLVILDEIGRGTSTYDGISIAWSIAEYLLTEENRKAKTLFATHYFELTTMEEQVPGAVNYNIAVHEDDHSIHFLRKIVRGSADKSYGIHVGKLAGLPLSVTFRAQQILEELEENNRKSHAFTPPKAKRLKRKKDAGPSMQLTLFQ